MARKPALRLFVASLVCAVGLLLPSEVKAQVSTASVNGTARDSSGAVIPGAKVLLHNVATNVDRTTVTNDVGRYVVVNVPPGQYRLSVTKQGFETQASNLTLVVDQTATLDFTMPVGATTQTVTVQATAVQLQASTAELGTAITHAPVNDLPLNGRNFTQLLTLTPGVSPANVSQNSSGVSRAGVVGAYSFPSVNGQMNRSNFFIVDGVTDYEPTVSTYAVAPIVDDIQEFKVDSHNDQAMFGSVTGGIVNVVTKSGTNQFHGTLWDYLRNQKLDSRNPFFSSRNPLRQNQFGADVGGPVILPHYNGRNKTFFFASFEGLRRNEAAQRLFKVPTPEELGGDLSDLGIPIYNPFSTRPDPNNPGEFIRDEFTGGSIPTNLLDPGAVTFARALFPAPVATGVSGFNGIDNTPVRHTANTYTVRVDQQLGTRDSAWFHFMHDDRQITGSGGYAGLASSTEVPAYQLATSWTHTLGPTALLQFQFGHVRSTNTGGNKFLNAPSDLISQVGFVPGFAGDFLSGGSMIPNVNISGFLSGGESHSDAANADIWEWKANFSKTSGKHLFNTGFDFNKVNLPWNYTEDLNVAFSSFQTSNPESRTGTGSPLASFLLGVPDNSERRNVNGPTAGGKEIGMYFQDQWKTTNKLTVNLGIRYDLTYVPRVTGPSGYAGNMNLNNGAYELFKEPVSCSQAGAAPCIPGGTLPEHVVVSPNGYILQNDYGNIQPRLGVAYRLFPRTVLRASYGRFFDNWAAIIQSAQNLRGQWPSLGLIRVNNLNVPTIASPTPTTTMENPAINGTELPPPDPFTSVAFFRDPLMKNPLADQWQFGIQHQLTRSTVLEADYVGSHDGRLPIGGFKNTSVTPGPGDASLRRPYPYITPTYYDQSVGRSNYNAFQFKVDGHTTHGLTYLVSYTYSKAISMGCDGFFGVEGCSVENPYNFNNDRSVSSIDLTHILSAAWVWSLPFGSGRRFNSGNKAVNAVVGNWQVNGIMTMTTGLPFTVTVPGDIANTGNGGTYERPDLIGNPSLGNPTILEWFNTAAFAVPAPFTFGNVGRNTLRGNWFKNLDLSVFREIPLPISETTRLQFRAEMFNSTNTPTWGNPVNNRTNTNFGKISSTRSTERQIQFSLKLYF
jgi:Carboxypeptidase regulatory-like domain/TonB dependent receptor-like, beta-barrel